MLPSRMQLPLETEDQLKKLKVYTGITPNVAARIAFFKSIESGYIYILNDQKLDGTLVLDKVTWLGETSSITELILKLQYEAYDQRQMARAWAAHVHDGLTSLRNHRSFKDFVGNI
ncbi:DNA sulfur modification protein DndE [Pseudomonas viridiflava]|uniref:DNA sulfur modification protein DndE n=1 Tax=Pseudomonas viridiflava TaxID=33069 RepID=UPI002EA1D753|nr:DNA sulfur modification protein DndE [Pseudomonas viridiflava]